MCLNVQACGLEILYHQAKGRGSDSSFSHAEDDPKWAPFLQRLKECDYFSSEMEGSEKYQKKLSSAKEYFLSQRGRKEVEGKKEWDQDHE